ncbi:MAG: fibronectin type III domain-containing protein [Bacteroidales bacterium]|nr:fibronectin type III domain-containing protein [Bacteroidales bacterium]
MPDRTGWWKFDIPSNLQKAESGYGADLILSGSHSSASGPEAGNGATKIGAGSYYKMQHLIPGNGGGSFVNEYTLQFDFKVSSTTAWHAFFQTSQGNSNDGDFFINPSGNIGVAAVGYSAYSVNPNEWYRLIISVKNGSFFNCYLDGQFLTVGNVQDVDGRFSLENLLLIFADDDGEDSEIYCSELAIWDQALNTEQVNELGGFGHNAGLFLMTRIPYLQAPGKTSMTVCWHDVASTNTRVSYGIDSTLGTVINGTNELISDPFRWHSVSLTGLQANTRYYYKVGSGDGESGIYSFKTLPDNTYNGKLRFILLSDTHASDTTMAGKVLRAARQKIIDSYGPDIENHLNGILHSGDIVVSGDVPKQYSMQYFQPLSALSANVPTMVVAGNHELESPYFYQYLKMDELSAFPQNPALKEKIWQIQYGNALFIGLNTNISDQYGETQANWLDSRLNEAETDASIDFVYIFFHHPPISELWIVGGTEYVNSRLLPVMKKYSKVREIHYGHTHGYERGTETSEIPGGDIRMICNGGGGGGLDPWAAGENQDYNDIHICISNYFFQLLEIDVEDHSYQSSIFSLGTLSKPKNSELIDQWHKVKNQSRPTKPSIESITSTENYIEFTSSVFSGIDSIMSVRFQVIDSSMIQSVAIDSTINWTNTYGVDSNGNPIDLNKYINLYQNRINKSQLSESGKYYLRVQYRDQNLNWSNWSEMTAFNPLGVKQNPKVEHGYLLEQNYPNPFREKTTILYSLPKSGDVSFYIYDINNKLIEVIQQGKKSKGTHEFIYSPRNLNTETLLYEMKVNNIVISRKMICSK